METSSLRSRRQFLGLVPALVVTFAGARRAQAARRPASGHPDPRPGIDGSRVAPRERLSDEVAPIFDMAREIPATFDGIRCQCGCAELPEMYSLLSCFEGDGMAQHCMICRGEARLVHRLHGEGRTLDEIRAAVDRRYG